MNFTTVPKANFNFGRVHIDVHTRWVHLHVQHIDRLALAVEDVLISTPRAVGDDFVTHKSAIDIGKLLISTGASGIGRACPTSHMHRP